MNVSFHVAKIWQTAKRSPETFWGPRLTAPFSFYSASSCFFVCSTFSGFSALAYLVATGAGFATSAINGYYLI
jgi:hypothetical protein